MKTPNSHNPASNTPRIGILGAGAIGQLLCWQLTQAKLAVTLIGKSEPLHRQQAGSGQSLLGQSEPASPFAALTFSPFIDDADSGNDSHYQVPLACIPTPHSADLPAATGNQSSSSTTTQTRLSSLKLIIVCVKAYQVVEALTPLLPLLSDDCHILLLHNGMGPHLEVAALLGLNADEQSGRKPHCQRGLSLGTTSQGALKLSRWHVRQTGRGLSQFGDYLGKPLDSAVKSQLLSAIPNSQWCDDIVTSLWQKLAVNAVINPLTAIHRCQNGALAQPVYAATIEAILDELHTIATLDGIKLEKSVLHTRVEQVIELTSSNFSSMYQDVTHKRLTEIAYINGYLLARAQAHGLSLDINASLVEKIKNLESHKP